MGTKNDPAIRFLFQESIRLMFMRTSIREVCHLQGTIQHIKMKWNSEKNRMGQTEKTPHVDVERFSRDQRQ